MLKKDITFEDLAGNKVTETHYFHLSKADLIELQLGKQGGFEEWLQRVIAAENGKELVRALKDIILMAYGVKSDDGRRFVKNGELRDEFANSEAFAELFAEVALDQDKAAEFVNGIIPRGMNEQNSGQQSVFEQDEPQPPETAVASPPELAPEPAAVAEPHVDTPDPDGPAQDQPQSD